MPSASARHSRIVPRSFVGAAAAAALGVAAQTVSAQAFTAAAGSLTDYTKAKLVPKMACAALGQYTAPNLLRINAVAIEAGKGIPAHKVYGNVGSKVLVTGLDGSVQFVCDGNSYSFHVLPAAEQPAASGNPHSPRP